MLTIGLSANWNTEKGRSDLPHDYALSVRRAGALPVVYPLLEDEEAWQAMVDLCDGFIFVGGDDVHPRHYGQEPLPQLGKIVEARDRQEIALYHLWMKTNKPFLAICRGMQLVNILRGGGLYQDIPSQYETPINHARFDSRNDHIHTVDVVADTRLYELTKSKQLPVNSRHHQAVSTVGQGLRVCALAPDGLVEALETTQDPPGILLQWHPESLSEQDPKMQALFDWLVNEAARRK